MITLQIEKRDKKANTKKLRESGKIPAIFYGRKTKATEISVPMQEFIKVWRKAGETTLIELAGEGEAVPAMIYATDVDPVTGVFRHVDFYTIEKGQKIEVGVPLNFVGVSAAVKDLGGILVKVMHEFKLEAEPRYLPQSIDVNINVLSTLESQILVKDVALPANVTLLGKLEEVVAAISVAKEEVEEAPTTIDMTKIEVSDAKGKKEDEEAVPGAEPAKAKKEDGKKAE